MHYILEGIYHDGSDYTKIVDDLMELGNICDEIVRDEFIARYITAQALKYPNINDIPDKATVIVSTSIKITTKED